MLVNEPMILESNFILEIIAKANGNQAKSTHLQTGVYSIGHFGCSRYPSPEYESPEPELIGVDEDYFGNYGVCDSIDNLLLKCPMLISSERKFVITLTSVKKENQPPEGGWRWHKWGEYIGEMSPQCEYLHDEPSIKEVFCYHVYERIS